ncbi:MAG: peroxide stress protein YaaA [Rhodospirillales bacterium]|nr:peroxide stress protein YaaA [Rhodospirillales bacterium]
MLALISPAKKLDFTESPPAVGASQPGFLKDSETLVKTARKLSRRQLQQLMGLSDKLADLNYERFKAFSTPFTADNAKQAVLAFSGDTYVGLDAASLDKKDLDFAQDHLRILSGLYGLLKPLDLIQPYRLEMGRRLNNPKGGDLYDFWGSSLTEAVNAAAAATKNPAVINLASNEYIKAVRPKDLEAPFITPVFKEVREDVAKVIGLFAKKARGMMARHIIKNRLSDPQALKAFTDGGYAYQPDLSDDAQWVFTRAG